MNENTGEMWMILSEQKYSGYFDERIKDEFFPISKSKKLTLVNDPFVTASL